MRIRNLIKILPFLFLSCQLNIQTPSKPAGLETETGKVCYFPDLGQAAVFGEAVHCINRARAKKGLEEQSADYYLTETSGNDLYIDESEQKAFFKKYEEDIKYGSLLKKENRD